MLRQLNNQTGEAMFIQIEFIVQGIGLLWKIAVEKSKGKIW